MLIFHFKISKKPNSLAAFWFMCVCSQAWKVGTRKKKKDSIFNKEEKRKIFKNAREARANISPKHSRLVCTSTFAPNFTTFNNTLDFNKFKLQLPRRHCGFQRSNVFQHLKWNTSHQGKNKIKREWERVSRWCVWRDEWKKTREKAFSSSRQSFANALVRREHEGEADEQSRGLELLNSAQNGVAESHWRKSDWLA